MFVKTDFVVNGAPRGELATQLSGVGYDSGFMRPYYNENGVPCVSVRTGTEYVSNGQGGYVTNSDGSLKTIEKREEVYIAELMRSGHQVSNVMNATTLRKDQWIQLDNVVLQAARQRLRAWADLRAANTFGGFDGMANPILEHERVNDPGNAVVDMDGMTEGQNFSAKFDLQGLPLPITHADFHLSERFLAASRNRGIPADTLRAQLAGRRIAETIEKTLIGIQTGITYGDSTGYGSTSQVYGYLTHPDRIIKNDFTAPDGTNGESILSDFLAARDDLYDANQYGPYMVYCSSDWDQYLDNLFSTAEPSAGTLRNRLKEIDGIQDIRRLDYLNATDNPFTLIFVQMTEDVARAINGMEIQTLQWDSMGGMRKNFKVMGIQVPQLRSDFNGNMGLLHGTTS
jgi:hypothetical protein